MRGLQKNPGKGRGSAGRGAGGAGVRGEAWIGRDKADSNGAAGCGNPTPARVAWEKALEVSAAPRRQSNGVAAVAGALSKEEARAKREALEAKMALQLRACGLAFDKQVSFWPGRRWRIDFVVEKNLALEVHGGEFSQGRHVRGKGMAEDSEKAAHALMMGYRVLAVTGRQVENGQAIGWVTKIVEKA